MIHIQCYIYTVNVIKYHRQLCFIFDLDSKHIVKLKILACSTLKSNQNVIFFFTVLLHHRNPNFGLCHIRIIILFFILWYQYQHNLILLVWFLKIPTAICYVLATIDQMPTSGIKNNLVITNIIFKPVLMFLNPTHTLHKMQMIANESSREDSYL